MTEINNITMQYRYINIDISININIDIYQYRYIYIYINIYQYRYINIKDSKPGNKKKLALTSSYNVVSSFILLKKVGK